MSTLTLDKQTIQRWSRASHVKAFPAPRHVSLRTTIDTGKRLSFDALRLLSQARSAWQDGPTIFLAPTLRKIESLKRLGENWNGHDVAAPDPIAILKAIAWIQSAFDEVLNRGWVWHEPHISASEEGEVVLEWWQAP